MIPPEVRVRIKVKHGNYYMSRISEVLLQRGIVNRNNKPHGGTMISKVFNGERDNPVIEDAIRFAYLDIFEAYESEIKKPEAVTPGFSK